ncbi:unnamed protein product [Boreogadus saida]
MVDGPSIPRGKRAGEEAWKARGNRTVRERSGGGKEGAGRNERDKRGLSEGNKGNDERAPREGSQRKENRRTWSCCYKALEEATAAAASRQSVFYQRRPRRVVGESYAAPELFLTEEPGPTTRTNRVARGPNGGRPSTPPGTRCTPAFWDNQPAGLPYRKAETKKPRRWKQPNKPIGKNSQTQKGAVIKAKGKSRWAYRGCPQQTFFLPGPGRRPIGEAHPDEVEPHG